MNATIRISRRNFLQLSVAASGGLLVGFYFPGLSRRAGAQAVQKFSPNAFLRIGTDERITVIVNHSEMGQGVYTALPMILCEELDADWSKVGYEPAPVDPAYNHPVFGIQMTGGSTSVWSSFEQFRKAGAAARAMLVAAAAQQWGVDQASCSTADGKVIHQASNRSLSYGKLAEAAAKMTPPQQIALKDPKNFKLIGKPIKRLDTPEKLNGKGIFGIDVALPGMLNAVMARPPSFGATLRKVDSQAAQAMPGIKKVATVPSGVAVIADSFWQAKKAREALKIDWDESAMAGFSSAAQREQYRELSKKPGLVARKDGDAESVFSGQGKIIEAEYEVPYLSHAMMEPLNCVVDLKADHCEIWTGTQFQTGDRAAAAAVAGLKPEQVQIHTTLLGGGFGRRANPANDFVKEAVHVAKAAGAPVKVIWTREDDMAGGYYRPSYLHSVKGGVDAAGNPIAWRQRIVGQSIMAGTPFEAFGVKNGIDGTSVEGAADLPYAIPNVTVEYHPTKNAVPVLWWRSVGHSHTAFVTECFLDELAALTRQDPFQLRRRLLANKPRHLGVLELAAQKAGWDKPLAKGRYRGIAVHEAFGSYSAQVAEVSVDQGKVRVHRVVCAIDCGAYVNPGIIEAQGHSGVVFGMSAALYGELTFSNGRLDQSNFHDYPVVRINECPEIEVHIVKNNERSGGIGEPGVPCTAPAIANAILAATGKPVRKLPIRLDQPA
jgi:isoquinoline 1-oxidoreductase subunit beta